MSLTMPIACTVKVTGIDKETGALTLAPGKALYPTGGAAGATGDKFIAPSNLCSTWTPPK